MKCVVELFGDDRNGRKMIAWGRRIGCGDAGHGFDPATRKIFTRLAVDDENPSQHSYLLELVDIRVGEVVRHMISTGSPTSRRRLEGNEEINSCQ